LYKQSRENLIHLQRFKQVHRSSNYAGYTNLQELAQKSAHQHRFKQLHRSSTYAENA
jgi:hypothetical protein